VQVAAIEALVEERQPERILEVGCATGRLLGRLESPNSSLVGLDLSPAALRRVPTNSHSPVVQGNAEAMPFADESFDFVIANHIIEHTDDADKLMAEIARVTRPEGVVFLSYPNEPILGLYASLGSLLLFGHPFGGRRMHLRKVRPVYFDDVPAVPTLKHVASRHSWLPMPQYFTTLSKLAA
jgi:ubiquinone/menaquinone biosynthesis C-methylase UbiE